MNDSYSNNPDKPIFHSVSKSIESEELQKKENLDTKLSETAELTILDFKKHPPKRRITVEFQMGGDNELERKLRTAVETEVLKKH